jgi:hypothetical protein
MGLGGRAFRNPPSGVTGGGCRSLGKQSTRQSCAVREPLTAKRVRCAVYTRVSTEYGLDQEFNFLDAQHEAAEAHIRSQAHDARYDDGGYSGGSTERPALQRLLADIRDRRIDIVVVYKVDRLTRSSPTSPSWSNCSTSIPSRSRPYTVERLTPITRATTSGLSPS